MLITDRILRRSGKIGLHADQKQEINFVWPKLITICPGLIMLSCIHDAIWHLSRFVTYVHMMPVGVYWV